MAHNPKTNPAQAQSAQAVSTGGAAARQTGRNIRLIIRREYTSRVRGRGYRITTIILTAAVVIGAFVPTVLQYFSSRQASRTSVVIVNNAGMADAGLLATANATLNGTAGSDRYAIITEPAAYQAGLQDLVRQGKVGILLVLERGSGGKLRITYTSNHSTASDPNQGPINSLAAVLTFHDNAQKLGLSAGQTASLMAAPDLVLVNTQQSQGQQASDSENTIRTVIAVFGAYLMLYTVMGYAASVPQGVALEKSSRIMEILVNAATPFQLMAGKIVGIGLASLTQMACLVVFGIAAMLIQAPLQLKLFGTASAGVTPYLAAVSTQAYSFFLIYFLLNFFLYAAVFAGLGAMVKNSEEVAGATMVPSALWIAGFLIFFLEIAHPNAVWLKVLAFIPFLSGPLMFGRVVLGMAAGWEIGLSIVIMLAAIYVCTLGAARIYRYGVLSYGQRPGLGGLLQLARKA